MDLEFLNLKINLHVIECINKGITFVLGRKKRAAEGKIKQILFILN